MYDHAELAAFLFYAACLAIQVIFDYRCVRCFSMIPGSRSARFFYAARLSLLLFSWAFLFIYFSVMYQSPAWLFFHLCIPLLFGYSFFLCLRWFLKPPLLAANCGMDDVPPSPVSS